MRGAVLGLLAGIALTVGAVSTSGIVSLGSQAAASSFPLADGDVADASAGTAGSVQVQRTGDRLTITLLRPASGWSPEVERQTGREVEVTFTNGTRRVHLTVELEDGQVRVSTADDVDDAPDPTVPGDDNNGDHRGPGRGAGDDDRSGPSANAGPGRADDADDDGGGGDDGPGHDIGDDHGDDGTNGDDDGANHDVGDDHGGGNSGSGGGGTDD
ncbi:MAG TPA: hypothetical protein VID94_01630, partial [Acidimicrobiales bacterium]